MKTSAGIIITYKNKVLLCHPTNSPFKNSFSFPKGGVNEGESLIDAAIRECREEVGIEVNVKQISKNFLINYTKKNSDKITKQVHLFLVEIDELNDIEIFSETIPKDKLQLEEVDWAGFLTKKEAKRKIFWRFQQILDELL